MSSPLFSITHGQTHSLRKIITEPIDKTKYVLLYKNLWFYLKYGLQLTKIHCILKFRQSVRMKPYIAFNMAKWREAVSIFILPI